MAAGLGLPATQVRPAYEDPLGATVGRGAAARGRGRRSRRRSGDRHRRRPRRPARPARAVGRRTGRLGAAAAPARGRRRLGQRRLAAAPRPHRAARGRLTGRAAAAAGLDQLAARRVRRSQPIRWPPAPTRAAGRPRGRATPIVEDAETAPITAMVAEVRDGLLYVFLPPTDALEDFVDLIARVEAAAAAGGLRGGGRGLRAAAGRSAAVDVDHPRPGRHRGQRRARPPASPSRASSCSTLYDEGPAGPAVDRVFRLRRHPRRHRRRQPHHPGRDHPGGLAVAAPARPAGVAADLLAAPPRAVLPVRRPFHRHHLAGAAGGRGTRRGALRDWRSPSPRSPDMVAPQAAEMVAPQARPTWSLRKLRSNMVAPQASLRGSPTGPCATCSPTSPATPTAPSSASTSSTAPTARAAGWDCWNCAASRCRRTTRWPWCSRCWCARWWRGSGTSRCAPR